MIVELFAKSDVGRVRRGNEDNFLLLELTTGHSHTGAQGAEAPVQMQALDVGRDGVILVVSDGMGGALAGDVASRMAVETVREIMMGGNSLDGSAFDNSMGLGELLRDATVRANQAIHDKSQSDSAFSGMGATFTGSAIRGDTLELVQVGDSRAYLIRGNEIKQITKDQSLVQQLVDVGQISEAEAETHPFRNVILQALGAQAELAPVNCRVRLHLNDVLLLCSDGLSGKLKPEDLQIILSDSKGDLAQACQKLVAEANARGGEDNITVVLARFTGEDLPEAGDLPITVEQNNTQEDDATLDDTDMPATEVANVSEFITSD
jgi:protein phosphatase